MMRQVRQKSLTYLLFTLFILASTCFSPIAKAQQVSFQQSHQQELAQHAFYYQWLDQKGQLRALNFSLKESGSPGLFASLKQFSVPRTNRILLRPLTHFAREQGWHQMEVSLSPFQKEILFRPHIRDTNDAQQRIARMREQERKERQKILNDSFLTMLTIPPNQTGIAPDHARIANASTEHVEPVSRAFFNSLSGSSAREYVSVIASFVQAIPYSELTNRLESGGNGFHAPAQLLFDNKGDCDSKVTLMAAILKNLMPNMTMAVVYMPNHALLAIAVNALEDDITIEYNGIQLVVVEPTGPMQLEVGKLSSSSALHVLNGNITVKPI